MSSQGRCSAGKVRLLTRVLPLFLAVGCAAAGSATSGSDLCPESRGLRCATTPDCTRDASRGCRSCQCSSPYPTAPYNPMQPPVAPTAAPQSTPVHP